MSLFLLFLVLLLFLLLLSFSPTCPTSLTSAYYTDSPHSLTITPLLSPSSLLPTLLTISPATSVINAAYFVVYAVDAIYSVSFVDAIQFVFLVDAI